MQWYHVYVLLLVTINFVFAIVKWARDPENSSTTITIMVMLMIAFNALYAYALHAGGFW